MLKLDHCPPLDLGSRNHGSVESHREEVHVFINEAEGDGHKRWAKGRESESPPISPDPSDQYHNGNALNIWGSISNSHEPQSLAYSEAYLGKYSMYLP